MRLEHETLELRTREPFHIARESDPHGRRNVRVRLIDDDGVEGWGEAAATPYYGETADTVAAALGVYGPLLDGEREPWALERIEVSMEGALNRNPAARAAVSAALHDLVGKRPGQPVWRLDPAAAPLSSFTLGMAGPDETREKARTHAHRPPPSSRRWSTTPTRTARSCWPTTRSRDRGWGRTGG